MSKTGKLTIVAQGEREIVFTRDFAASRARVFDAWTKPELLKSWLFGPDGHSLAICEIDLRVGGKLRFVWKLPNGATMGMSGIYKEIDAPSRLVHTEIFDEDWTGGETLVTLDLTEKDNVTATRMTVRYSSQAARDAVLKTPMAAGMDMGYARLDALLARR